MPPRREETPSRLLSARFGAVVFIFLVTLIFGVAAGVTPQAKEIETCTVCHEDLSRAYGLTPHAGAQAGCTACHGQAEKHIEEGGKGNIFAFQSSDLSSEKSKRCLACHSKDHPRFLAGPHAKASLDCTSCHVVHSAEVSSSLLRNNDEKNCSLCHGDVFAMFQLNERHRLEEGILSCTTCHDPHEPASRERLGGFKNESCLKCHSDKGGPYLYEHQAQRVEGCTVCHEVHGSPNRHMLKFQNSADLCFSCHAAAPAWHSRFTSDATNCVTCHTAVHGSNLSRLFLK
ncbi:MAG: cytochrome c3 family protein [Candidatus Aminicenantales bacterium]